MLSSSNASESAGNGGNGFTKSGYIGCSVATISLAIAMYFALRDPSLLTGRDTEIINAALVAIASSLCTVSLAFEVHTAKAARSPLTCLMLGIVAIPVFVWLFALHSALAWLAIAIVLIRMFVVIYEMRSLSLLVVVMASAMIGYWTFLLSFVDGYKTPWIDEAVESGTVHVDMLFHAAIVNMLSGFNAPSLGVDGLSPFPYHFGSHWLVVLLCHLLSIGPLKFYAVVFPLLFCPVFLLAFFFVVLSFRSFLARTGGMSDYEGNNAYSGWFWAAFFVVFVGLLPASYRRNLAVWDNVFHSESFGIAVLASYFAGIWVLDQWGRKDVCRLRWYAYPLLGLYLIALCSLKISVGAVVGGLMAYVVLRLPLPWFQRVGAWLAMSSAVVYGYVKTQVVAQGETSGLGLMQILKPFAFIRDILPPERWVPSFFAFFGPALLLVALRLVRSGFWNRAPGITGLISAIPRDVEMIVVVTLISIAPGLILSIPQGATNFFAEVSYWWVQPMLAVVLASTFVAAVQPRAK